MWQSERITLALRYLNRKHKLDSNSQDTAEVETDEEVSQTTHNGNLEAVQAFSGRLHSQV